MREKTAISSFPPALFCEVVSALVEAGRGDLAARLEEFDRSSDLLTSSQVATLLGVSSANTVKNWLEAGHFPGAFKTAGGHWRFPRATVQAARDRMDALREKNRHKDLTPPVQDEADYPPPPLL